MAEKIALLFLILSCSTYGTRIGIKKSVGFDRTKNKTVTYERYIVPEKLEEILDGDDELQCDLIALKLPQEEWAEYQKIRDRRKELLRYAASLSPKKHQVHIPNLSFLDLWRSGKPIRKEFKIFLATTSITCCALTIFLFNKYYSE